MMSFKQAVSAVLCSALMLGLTATAIAAEKKAALSPDEAKAKQAYALGFRPIYGATPWSLCRRVGMQ